MDKKDLDLYPEHFPSPEELFQIDLQDTATVEKQEQEQLKLPGEGDASKDSMVTAVAGNGASDADMPDAGAKGEEAPIAPKPASKYRVIKFFSAGFIILILAIALFITNMDKFHLHCYCMMTESMGDTIPKGSVVFSYEIPMEELQIGDVITYINSQGISITHQIVSEIENYNDTGSRAFYTKGTENAAVDEEAVTHDMIKGKVMIYIPYIAKPFIH